MKRSMLALMIGNSAYPGGEDLRNPTNDAADLGAKLEQYGFDVVVAKDRTHKEMDGDLKAFGKRLDDYEVAVFFVAGHGIQIEGVNYLLAIDTDVDSEEDAKFSSLSLDKVMDVMARSKVSTKIIILDACRSNPWERKWHRGSGGRGLASVYAPKGTIIGFATSPGEVAYDGVGRNGTYTAALLQHIETPDCTIEAMFKRVRNTVAAASAGKQTSWEHTSLSGEFYFNLSLGALIDAYDGSALADGLFVIDETKKSHRIIAGLKSYNWYAQNPALRELDAATANKTFEKNLFVIGRNVYQAASGSAATAVDFVNDFMRQTSGFKHGKRKALLDGMLFEIFFDSQAKLRDNIKSNLFEEVFELQRFPELKPSFDFIAEALVAAQGNFFAIPGKGHELAVTVSIKKKKGEFRIDAIYVGGMDVLRDEDEPSFDAEGKRVQMTVKPSRLERRLSEDLVVPQRLLKVTYTQEIPEGALMHIPRGWKVRKV